jgi:Ca2+-binding EF-hand superfamily protein
LEKPSVEQQWKSLGGDKKGYLTTAELVQMFDKNMPRYFDRDIAFEMFREVGKDGRLTFKEFFECLKFQL